MILLNPTCYTACKLAAVQCIVIGPVCGCVAVFVCLWVCLTASFQDNLDNLITECQTIVGLYHDQFGIAVNSKLRASNRSSPN